MTATEVLEPTVSEYEIERGKPLPSRNHARVQMYLGANLLRYEDRFSTLSELTLDVGGRDMTPDLCIYPKLEIDWQHDVVKMTEMPLTTIEILSPRQAMDDLVRKADAYFEAGVRSCWIVQPMIESLTILTPGERPQSFSHGEITDPVTDITVRLEEIFR